MKRSLLAPTLVLLLTGAASVQQAAAQPASDGEAQPAPGGGTQPAQPAPGGAAQPAPAGKAQPAPREGLSVQDRKFLAVAAKANEDQIRLCRFAEKKAKSPEVKDFARKMVADHTAVAGEIAGLEHTRTHEHAKAKARPHAWRAHAHLAEHAHPRHHPRTAQAGHPGNDEISKLRGKSGADFDRAFMQQQVDFHARTVEKLDGEAKSAGSEKMRDFATQAAGAFQKHLDLAKTVSDKADKP